MRSFQSRMRSVRACWRSFSRRATSRASSSALEQQLSASSGKWAACSASRWTTLRVLASEGEMQASASRRLVRRS
eukprot:362049-Alexandrium_andersonii.AAC.1